MTTSEAQKRAHQKLADARRSAGKAVKSFWLTEAARERLRALAKTYGSEEKALEALLVAEPARLGIVQVGPTVAKPGSRLKVSRPR